MITFKKFFEDNAPGDIDIIAHEPNAPPENLGQTTDVGKRKISNIITSIKGGSEKLVRQLVDGSEFTNISDEYYTGLLTLINSDRYDIDWEALKRHIDERFLRNKLEDKFADPHGEFDLKEWSVGIIQQFVKNDPESFFEQIFEMGYKIRNTAVGGGEFALAILGNGKKGQKGDVDVPTLLAGTMVLEIGTQMKIIGDATLSRAKGISSFKKFNQAVADELGQTSVLDERQLPANQIRLEVAIPTAAEAAEVGLGGEDGIYRPSDAKDVMDRGYTGYIGPQPDQREQPPVHDDAESKKRIVTDLLKTYKAKGNIKENDYDKIYKKLLASTGPKFINPQTSKPLVNAPTSNINRIVGAVVLYDYIINHNDDVIVSINAGDALQGGFDPYHTRYVKIGKNGGLDVLGVVDLMVNEGWFDFKIDPRAVKFTLGARSRET